MTVVEIGSRGPLLIETACYAPVEVGAAVVFLGQNVEDGRWLLWWAEQDGIGGVWHGSLLEAWAEFTELTRAA